jgi:hypothetical protein
MTLAVNTLFDESFYLEQNLDVAEAVSNGELSSGLEHFLLYGLFEGRNPSVLFDTTFYLEENPDVAQAVATEEIRSAFEHFILYGQFEGRNPNLLFDTSFYLLQNPDVAAAVIRREFSNAFEHFILYGQFEKRDPSSQFDTEFYLEQNPDVAQAVAAGTISSAIEHFLEFGQFEGRDPNIVFDTNFYLQQNPDVAEAVANGEIKSAFEHFLQYGQTEERAPNPNFDESFYLVQNPDVAVAVATGRFNTGLEHFLTYGRFEGRDPGPLYNETFYLAGNPDVRDAVARGIYSSGVEHFFLYGQFEGRIAVNPALRTIADFRWNPTNTVSSGSVVEGALDGFFLNALGQNSPGFDFSQTTGRLLGSNLRPQAFAVAAIFPDVDIQNPPQPNVTRTTIALAWEGGLLPNAPGRDFVIYESGYIGEPEGYIVSVQKAGESDFSNWRYEVAESFELFDPITGAGVFATAFDLNDFGIAPGEAIEAIYIRNIFNSQAQLGGDRIDSSGQGNVLFPGTPGYDLGFTLTTGPLGSGGEYATDQLDADITYVVGLNNIIGATPLLFG